MRSTSIRRTISRAGLAALLLVGISLGSTSAAFNTTEIAGIGPAGQAPDVASYVQDISADGRVVFLSGSTVFAGTTPNWYRVYLRSGSTTTAVNTYVPYSVERAGISDNGRYVVYTLGYGDAPAVYLYDSTDQSTVQVVTIGSTYGQFVQNSQLDVSDDGRYVLFDTVTGLDATDANGVRDVYRYDRQLASLDWVSRNPNGTPSDGESTQPRMTPDGSAVVFSSVATNLIADDTNVGRDVFLWTSGTLTRVSTDASGTQLSGGAGAIGARADITDDGRYVVFDSNDGQVSAVPGWQAVILKDTVTGAVEVVSHDVTKRDDVNARFATISGDGSVVVYESDWPFITTGIQGNHYDAVIKDRTAGTIELLDGTLANAAIEGNRQASNPVVNTDGTIAAFDSQATDLVASPAVPPFTTQVYRVTRSAKLAQAITFTNPGGKTLAQSPLTLSGTTSSGLVVQYTSLTPLVCQEGSATGSPLILVGAGSCKVTASQPGNQSYNAATSVTRTFNVTKANQTITFANPGAKTLIDSPLALIGTASSGMVVTFASTTPAVCYNWGTYGETVFLVATGSCSITASQSGSTVYNATSVTRTFNVNLATQVVSFASPGNKTMKQTPVTVSATTTSPLLPVTFTTSTPFVCTAGGPGGTIITLLGPGTCTVTAEQAGDATWKPDTQSRSFTVTKVAQKITFTNPGAQTLGSSLTPVATSDSLLVVTFTTTTPLVCTTDGTTIDLIAIGTCTVRADQAGDAVYKPANGVNRSFAVR